MQGGDTREVGNEHVCEQLNIVYVLQDDVDGLIARPREHGCELAKGCLRVHKPPQQWCPEDESAPMMTYCEHGVPRWVIFERLAAVVNDIVVVWPVMDETKGFDEQLDW